MEQSDLKATTSDLEVLDLSESTPVGTEEEQYKGALKITRIKNRRYIRMPNFSKRAVTILKSWLHEHLHNPYPTHKEKELLSKESGLSKKQIQNWFTNARKVNKLSLYFFIEDLPTLY